MKIMIDGQEINLPPQGPSGPDGNPLGTVISFMGTSAPTGYLVCDGAEYEISAYPALANFFEQQFGTKNHFGGNGTDTFAVPDLRNLFLRGYHGQAEEQLSGEVAERQEATESPSLIISRDNIFGYSRDDDQFHQEVYPDTVIKKPSAYYTAGQVKGQFDTPRIYSYTARPVNMAVLYCIKAK